MVSDDVCLEVVGVGSLTGRTAPGEQLAVVTPPVQELVVLNPHQGKWCTSDGTARLSDKSVASNNLYTFTGHGQNALLQDVHIYAVTLAPSR